MSKLKTRIDSKLAALLIISITMDDKQEPRRTGEDAREQSIFSRLAQRFSGRNQYPLGANSSGVCWHPYEQSQADHSSTLERASSPHLCNPSIGSGSSAESDSSSSSLVVDPNLILDSSVSMALAKDGPNMMTVKMASICHNDLEEDYKMTSQPRGPCLIINNIDFEADIFPTRKGSDEDARRFDDIFQQLGFTVIMRRNQTADQMRKLFKDVAAECKPEHDALFVFILSHGSEHGIYGTDGIEVNLETEIVSCFDNRNCKAMLGKPKVLVIQACRGSKYPIGQRCPTKLSEQRKLGSRPLRAPNQLVPLDSNQTPFPVHPKLTIHNGHMARLTSSVYQDRKTVAASGTPQTP